MKNKLIGSLIAATVILGGGFLLLSQQDTALAQENSTTPVETQLPTITVFKSATCGCCKDWISHLERSGFQVKANDVGNLLPHKQNAKLGAGMGSCHTAFVDGYAVEGHVPADDIKRMLLEKPDISGLTVPRMPVGSPGMEVEGQTSDAFQVISYKDGEQVEVYADYPAGSTFQ